MDDLREFCTQLHNVIEDVIDPLQKAINGLKKMSEMVKPKDEAKNVSSNMQK